MNDGCPSEAWTGALAGLFATIPQTAAMEAVRRGLPGPSRGRFPPRQVAEAIVMRLLGRRRPPRWSEPTWWVLTAASHFGFGTVAGAVYPRVLPIVTDVYLGGAGFGLAVWASNYLVLFPVLGIDAPQGDRPIRKAVELIAAHVAWGTATAVLYRRLGRSITRSPSAASTAAVPPPSR